MGLNKPTKHEPLFSIAVQRGRCAVLGALAREPDRRREPPDHLAPAVEDHELVQVPRARAAFRVAARLALGARALRRPARQHRARGDAHVAGSPRRARCFVCCGGASTVADAQRLNIVGLARRDVPRAAPRVSRVHRGCRRGHRRTARWGRGRAPRRRGFRWPRARPSRRRRRRLRWHRRWNECVRHRAARVDAVCT